MLPFFDPLRQFTFGSLVLRLLTATLCGAAIGIERSMKTVPPVSARTFWSASAAPSPP